MPLKLGQGPAFVQKPLQALIEDLAALGGGGNHGRTVCVARSERAWKIFLDRQFHAQVEIPTEVSDPETAGSQYSSEQIPSVEDRPGTKVQRRNRGSIFAPSAHRPHAAAGRLHATHA